MSNFEQVDEVGSQSVLSSLCFHQYLHRTQFLNPSFHLSHILTSNHPIGSYIIQPIATVPHR